MQSIPKQPAGPARRRVQPAQVDRPDDSRAHAVPPRLARRRIGRRRCRRCRAGRRGLRARRTWPVRRADRQPLAGYLGSVFSGYPVRVFRDRRCRRGAVKHDALKEALSTVHLVTSWVLMSRWCAARRRRGQACAACDARRLGRREWGSAAGQRRLRAATCRGLTALRSRRRQRLVLPIPSRAMSSAVLPRLSLKRRLGAGGEQRLHCFGLAVARRPHQRGQVVARRRRWDRRPCAMQQHARRRCGLRRRHRSSRSFRGGRRASHVGAARRSTPRHPSWPAYAAAISGVTPLTAAQVDVGAGVEHHLREGRRRSSSAR